MRFAVCRQVSHVLSSDLSSIKRRKPTSGLEPLSCSLRLISQVLQGFAVACKSRIPRQFPLLRFAECCTVLRSRWYQSGINTTLIFASRSQGSYVTTRLVLYRSVPELPDSGLTSNKHCSEPSAAH